MIRQISAWKLLTKRESKSISGNMFNCTWVSYDVLNRIQVNFRVITKTQNQICCWGWRVLQILWSQHHEEHVTKENPLTIIEIWGFLQRRSKLLVSGRLWYDQRYLTLRSNIRPLPLLDCKGFFAVLTLFRHRVLSEVWVGLFI